MLGAVSIAAAQPPPDSFFGRSNASLIPAGVARFGLVTNYSNATVSVYALDPATGRVRPLGYALTGDSPASVAIDPAGRFAYVVFNSGSLYGFQINYTTGRLSPIPLTPMPLGSAPTAAVIDPSGSHVYILDPGSKSIFAFSISPIDGKLSEVFGSPFSAPAAPTGPLMDPGGRFVFVNRFGAGNVAV